MAFGISNFLMPQAIAAGGPPGMAIIITQLIDTTPGVVIFVVNSLLMILGLRFLGLKFIIRTSIALLLISIMTDGLLYFFPNIVFTTISVLNALYAGIAIGLGVGLIFRGGGSSGGWSILVKLTANKFNISMGLSAMILDFTVVIISALVFRDVNALMLGAITVLVSSKLINLSSGNHN